MSESPTTTGTGRPRAIGSSAYVAQQTTESCPNCGCEESFIHYHTMFASPDHDYCDACDYRRTYPVSTTPPDQ